VALNDKAHLILIFSEAIGLFGLIISIILSQG